MAFVKIDSRELENLRRAARERDDYLQTSRLMREKLLDLVDGSPLNLYREGYLACQRDWNQMLLRVMAAREVEAA